MLPNCFVLQVYYWTIRERSTDPYWVTTIASFVECGKLDGYDSAGKCGSFGVHLVVLVWPCPVGFCVMISG